MTTRFQPHELTAEWARAAYVVGCHGPHVWGAQVATLHRFITHPHIQEEPMSTMPEGQVDQYRAQLLAANLPAIRIEPRLVGYRAGWDAAQTETAAEPTPLQVEQYRAMLAAIVGNGYQYCASAALGYRDGWAAAVSAR